MRYRFALVESKATIRPTEHTRSLPCLLLPFTRFLAPFPGRRASLVAKNPLVLQTFSRKGRPGPVTNQKVLTRTHIALRRAAQRAGNAYMSISPTGSRFFFRIFSGFFRIVFGFRGSKRQML